MYAEELFGEQHRNNIRQETISIEYTFVILELTPQYEKVVRCRLFESSEQQIKALENKRNSFRAIRVNNWDGTFRCRCYYVCALFLLALISFFAQYKTPDV